MVYMLICGLLLWGLTIGLLHTFVTVLVAGSLVIYEKSLGIIITEMTILAGINVFAFAGIVWFIYRGRKGRQGK